MTQDELKALWAELGENHYNHRIGDYANDIPPGPPRPGPTSATRIVPRVHAMLETHIRGEQQGAAGQPPGVPAPRARPTRSGTTASTSTSPATTPSPAAAPAPSGSSLELHANSGLDAQRPGRQGPRSSTTSTAWSTGSTAGWTRPTRTRPTGSRSAGEAMFAPLNVLEVAESRWQGHNPHVTEANVRSLDLANGGGDHGRLPLEPRRSSGRSPSTRPAARR